METGVAILAAALYHVRVNSTGGGQRGFLPVWPPCETIIADVASSLMR